MRVGLWFLLGAGVFWWLRRQAVARGETVSREWLAQQEAEGRVKGIDAVCWRWPYNVTEAEQGWRNRQHERRRA